ncbi:PREDICTED: protein misato homolog 1 isoform X2 [Nelumbo nucifera]|uniref:Protein misato homolog 1 isoform X2 n=1 Tax=Nelumbo nucifera TaxID=4432 RepID=A0A1U8ADY4_NELNU|nr:PREDICTED: protein misato homolog 1 isoform X2 [Nelumbo nucifera]
MREIVTIQVGSFANFIGSHFWNFQDELLGLVDDPHGDPVFKNQSLDMDVFYRAGEMPQGIPTYSPRLLSIDFQGTLGSLSSHGSLYHEIPSAPMHVRTWTGNVTKLVSDPQKKNLFLQRLDEEEHGKPSAEEDDHIQDKDIVECLENGVHFWTDFSKVHYHPQSLYELKGLWMDAQEFDNYGIGRDIFSEALRGEEINDRLRFFVEECDQIQGIQFIVDDSGGFSSVAAEFLENIADEYTNTPVLLYAARGPGPGTTNKNALGRKDSISKALHDAVSFSRLSSFSKLIVPIGLPFLSRSKASTFLCIEDSKAYHCSAVYAAALHSISLPFRMESIGSATDSHYVAGAIDVNGIVQMLAGQARQNMVAILDVAMPAPCLTGEQNKQSVQRGLHSLTPEIAEDVEDFRAIESTTVHGIHHSGGNPASISEVQDSIFASYESALTRPMFSHLSVALCPLPIPLPFPSIFSNLVRERGELLDSPIYGSQSRGSLDVHSIPMAARLRSSNAILPYIETRLGNLRRFGIEKGAPGSEVLRSWGFEKDELQDMGEELSRMVMALDPREESSDSD